MLQGLKQLGKAESHECWLFTAVRRFLVAGDRVQWVTSGENVVEEQEVGVGVKASRLLDSVLLPRLTTLEVHSYHQGTLSRDAFQDFIQALRAPPTLSQIPGVARLQHARLTNHWDSPLDSFMRMARSSAFERLSPFMRSLLEYGISVGVLFNL